MDNLSLKYNNLLTIFHIVDAKEMSLCRPWIALQYVTNLPDLLANLLQDGIHRVLEELLRGPALDHVEGEVVPAGQLLHRPPGRRAASHRHQPIVQDGLGKVHGEGPRGRDRQVGDGQIGVAARQLADQADPLGLEVAVAAGHSLCTPLHNHAVAVVRHLLDDEATAQDVRHRVQQVHHEAFILAAIGGHFCPSSEVGRRYYAGDVNVAAA